MPFDFEATFDRNLDRYIEEWKQVLRFPSIGSHPEHAGDCMDCANWLLEHVRGIGFEGKLLETSSFPVVYGERKGSPGAPTVLFYGHYDVQPVDPLDEWTAPPFEPSLRDGRMYARGANDDKGQVLYALKAFETLIADGSLAPTVKLLIEGEEECGGSRGMARGLPDWHDLVQADVLMVTDTGMSPSGAPAIVMGLRGVLYLTALLLGPHHDLHSGLHGGVSPNPAEAMARLVATLHNEDGSIAVDGFLDGVRPPTARERELAAATPFDADKYRKTVGVPPTGGEQGLEPWDRLGFRPTIEVNGIHSGYGDAGAKTIIPATAIAKISARLVPGQDPESCLEAIIAHLAKHAPGNLNFDVPEKGLGGAGFRLDPNSAVVEKARGVLDNLTEFDSVFLWEGASIPIVSELWKASGAEPLLVGFGTERDRVHAPDESFSLEQFKLGYLYVAEMLTALAPA